MSEELRISWHDSSWVPHLNPENVLDYFCQKSNPFYDKLSNNEVARMQNLHPEQMKMMTGKEFVLLHVQDPILYVIRKQDRLGPDNTIPLTDYYILAGVVYQAPDLNSIIQSRVLNCALNLKGSLDEFQKMCSFNPSTGYSWNGQQKGDTTVTERPVQHHGQMTTFQRKVDALMAKFAEGGN